jgi:Plasma-membrane choline transporter
MLFMRKRIGLANGIMKESARAINAVPLLVLMPVFEAIGMVAFFIPFIYYGEFTYTHIYMYICVSITDSGTVLDRSRNAPRTVLTVFIMYCAY